MCPKNMLSSTSVIEFPNLKKTRRYGAKVKTGCITCKARHVKCDEARPICSRCMNTGRKCDGYAQDRGFQLYALGTGTAFSIRHIDSNLAGSSEEIRYLEFYQNCARLKLSSTFDDEFWSRIAPQMGQREPAVHHALLALGYLYQQESGSLKHARQNFMDIHQHKALLHHYNRAVRCLINRMAEPSYETEIGLSACLIFICIEFLRGNYHTAFVHLKSGLRMISEYQKRTLVQLISPESMLRYSSGTASIVGAALTPLFIRAVASAQLYGVSSELDLQIPCPRPHRLQERPFTTVLDAQLSNYVLRNSAILFARTVAKKIILNDPITAEDLRYQSHLLDCHFGWLAALEMLEKERPLSQGDRAVASFLKVGYYSTYIMVACAVEVRQQQYDAHISGFKSIIHHARTVIESMGSSRPHPSSTSALNNALNLLPEGSAKGPAANFTLEVSLIPCLHFAANRCRCPRTRREAVSLLKCNLPREALWDPEQHYIVSNRVIQIEERELDSKTGWPVERTRLWSAVIDGNMDRQGGFWVSFAFADWVRETPTRNKTQKRRLDTQWDEWLVL